MSNEVKKKVFVSGCYDMLHSGHVAFFEEAATYGDLYVGIGSDKTIQELKARKTINTEDERLYMVKSLKAVKEAWINSGSGLLDFEKEKNYPYGEQSIRKNKMICPPERRGVLFRFRDK